MRVWLLQQAGACLLGVAQRWAASPLRAWATVSSARRRASLTWYMVWSATRSLTVVDQVEMLAWMAMEGGIERACLTSVRSHVGIPAERRAPLLSVQLSDPRCQAVLLAYPESAQSAECVLEQLRHASPSHI